MTLSPGSRLGPYEVAIQIGQGGMGEVYRATDTNLKRQVAIKVLPESVAADAERLARFQREAEVLAALNHPNIAAIYGLERAGTVTALVMELVEGPTLANRIAKGAIPPDEALPIARQIAEALEAAHGQGIIHRDLKPANIKVRDDGLVKVLDFGLAKAVEPVVATTTSNSMSPTITKLTLTQAGVLLGTAAYMSPEQARGKDVDKRADIWAFGAVWYEMLTGKRAFEAEDVSLTLAEVMKSEPNWTRLPALPPVQGAFLRQCLKKDPKQRVQAIGDVRLALEGGFETSAPLSSVPRGRMVWMAAFAVSALGAVAMAVPALRHLAETSPLSQPETRTEIVTAATDRPTSFAVSPDGRQMVFVATGDGASRLWLRPLTSTTAVPLAGTEGASAPFWSPDSRSIGYFASNALKRLELGGGAPQTLAPVTSGGGGTWSADGVIVFSPSTTTALMRVAATSSTAVPVTTLGVQQTGHVAPFFLPDGRRFLYSVRGTPDRAGIYLGALDGTDPVLLTLSDSAAVYQPSAPEGVDAFSADGWMLWARAGRLVAQRLDVSKPALIGEAVTVADGVASDSIYRSAAVSVALTGLIAYRTGIGNQRQLTWRDRSGTVRGTVGDSDATLNGPRVSPDGRRVAVSRTVQGNEDLWLLDGDRMSRFTFDAARDVFPVWSPDGSRIVFRSERAGPGNLYQKLTSGAGQEERFVASDQPKTPYSWTSDGRFLLYHSIDPQTSADLWVAPMIVNGSASAYINTPFREVAGAFSPDGRWIAYHSNESGLRNEIYVQRFVPSDGQRSAAAGQWQVSTTGGIHPVWSLDGKELYYLNPSGAIVAVSIISTGGTFASGAPAVLFPAVIYGGGVDAQQIRQYDIARDGLFLINAILDSAAAPITLIQNWNPEAKQ